MNLYWKVIICCVAYQRLALATVLAHIYHGQSNQIGRDKSLCLIYSHNSSQSSLIYYMLFIIYVQIYSQSDLSFIL